MLRMFAELFPFLSFISYSLTLTLPTMLAHEGKCVRSLGVKRLSEYTSSTPTLMLRPVVFLGTPVCIPPEPISSAHCIVVQIIICTLMAHQQQMLLQLLIPYSPRNASNQALTFESDSQLSY
ncbi:hypothetical protein V8C44DRAFT_59213 [Trichoderma aethiopicum]